jgi:phosphocarrier protein HPr
MPECPAACVPLKIFHAFLPMLTQDAPIINQLGLHARASSKLTQLAATFKSDVWFSRNGRRVNGKSIMGVMMLAAGMGTSIKIEADGADEALAMAALQALIADKFGEGK